MVDSRRSLLIMRGWTPAALAFFDDEAVEAGRRMAWRMRAHPYDETDGAGWRRKRERIGRQYMDFASHGFHVIGANKLAGTSASDVSAKDS